MEPSTISDPVAPTTGTGGELDKVLGASAPVSPIKLPVWLPEATILSKLEKCETDYAVWNKIELQRIEDKYKMLENKQGAGITTPDGPIIPLFYSTVETIKSTVMAADFSQQKLVDLLPEGQESLKQAPMVPNPAFMAHMQAPPPPVDHNEPPPPGMPPIPAPLPPPDPMIPDPAFKSAADIASIMEDFLGESVYDTPDYFQKKDNLFQNLLIENMMVSRVKWEEYEDYDLQTQQSPETVMQSPVTVQAGFEKKTKGCPNFVPRSVRGLGFDPRCQYNFRAASWLRDRTMVTKEELLTLQAKGTITNVDKIEMNSQIDNANQSQMTDPNRDPQARQAKQVEGVNLPVGNTTGQLIQLDEYWAEFSGEGDNATEMVDLKLWIANGKTILMAEPNDPTYKFLKRPFAVGVINQKSGQVSGMGPLDAIMALIRDIANVLSAKKKLIWQAANAITFYEPVSMLDGKRTLLEGHTLVPTLSSKNINRFPPPSEAIAVLDRHLQFLITKVHEATAANDQAQGIGSEGNDTATEAKILAASSGKRLQYLINMVNSTWATQVIEGYLELYRQCGIQGDMVTREAGVDGEPIAITYDMLKMRFKIRPISAAPQSQKIARFNQLQNLLMGLLQLPPGTLTNDQGKPMQVNAYDFMVQDMLPLIDVRGAQRLFRTVDAPMGMPQMPQQGQGQHAMAPPPPTMEPA